ncbi:MAG: KpsF/GutQ family sugar-phosphate isomerase [Coxiellaceae bacterium]|nr:KpsF/GutQ family sugar-phosphate isomerase [Coxiellaceae bacterium]
MITEQLSEIEQYCALGKAVIETEAKAVKALLSRIDEKFVQACQLLIDCQGRIVVTGMGKSGHIGGKIAATFASTGTPAFFVHPGEANHGDMGMITAKDVVLAISYSGESDEIQSFLPLIHRFRIPLISLTGNSKSSLAKRSNVHIDVSVDKEACPLGLAPTASTTATLAMGDALAVALLEKRGFTAEDFALYHPAGSLGKRLLLRVDSLIQTGDAMPVVTPQTSIADALVEITSKRLGMTTVIQDGQLAGIYTDGDIRRTLDKQVDIHRTAIAEVMSKNPKTIALGTLAVAGLEVMSRHKITSLVVVNEHNQPAGVLHMHDLLKAGVA